MGRCNVCGSIFVNSSQGDNGRELWFGGHDGELVKVNQVHAGNLCDNCFSRAVYEGSLFRCDDCDWLFFDKDLLEAIADDNEIRRIRIDGVLCLVSSVEAHGSIVCRSCIDIQEMIRLLKRGAA